MKQKPFSVTALSSFYDLIEKKYEAFTESVKDFARNGDERDGWDEFESGEIKARIDACDEMTVANKKKVLSYLKEKEKEAQKISGLASDHQMSMQRHESGSPYHLALGNLQEALGA